MFAGRRKGSSDDAVAPRGLASLVAALQSQRGVEPSASSSGSAGGAAGFAGGLNAAPRLAQRHGFAGLGLAAASAAAGSSTTGDIAFGKPGPLGGSQHGGSNGLHSHAISPAVTTYQPASPQTREGASPARRAACARLAGFPLQGGSNSVTPSITSGDEEEALQHPGLSFQAAPWHNGGAAEGDSSPQTVAELRAALAAAEGAARVAAWARDAAERRAEAAESAAAAAGVMHRQAEAAKPNAAGAGITECRGEAADSAAATAAGVTSAPAATPAAAPAGAAAVAAVSPAASLALPAGDAHALTGGDVAPGAAAEQRDAGASPPGSDGKRGGGGDAAGLAEARRCIAELQRQLEAATAELEERQEPPRVAELQAELLAQSAEVAAAERRAELAERQKAESQHLLVALQAALMQSAVASQAGTPLHSPRGLSRTPRSASPAAPRSRRGTSVPPEPCGMAGSPPRASRLGGSQAGSSAALADRAADSAAAEGAALSAAAEATATAAEQRAADAAAIAALRAELDTARAERDAARHVAARAAAADGAGPAELWRQLLEAETAARVAAAEKARTSGGVTTAGSTTPGSPARPLGELWQRLEAVSAEREALQRSASQAEQQLCALQRPRSVSATSGDLSRAFAAAAVAASPTTPLPAKRPRRSLSSSGSSPDRCAATDAGASASTGAPADGAAATAADGAAATAAAGSGGATWGASVGDSPAAREGSGAGSSGAPTSAFGLAASSHIGPQLQDEQQTRQQETPPATTATAADAAAAARQSTIGSAAEAAPSEGIGNGGGGRGGDGNCASLDAALWGTVLWGQSAAIESLAEPLRSLAERLALLPTFVRLLLARAVASGRLALRDLLGSGPMEHSAAAAAAAAAGGGAAGAVGATATASGSPDAAAGGTGAAAADPRKPKRTDRKVDDAAAASDVPAALGAAVVAAAADVGSSPSPAAASRDHSLAPGCGSGPAAGAADACAAGPSTEIPAGADSGLNSGAAALASATKQPHQQDAGPALQQAAAIATGGPQPPKRWAGVPQLGTMLHPDAPLQQAGLAGVSLATLGAVAAWWYMSGRRTRRLPWLLHWA